MNQSNGPISYRGLGSWALAGLAVLLSCYVVVSQTGPGETIPLVTAYETAEQAAVFSTTGQGMWGPQGPPEFVIDFLPRESLDGLVSQTEDEPFTLPYQDWAPGGFMGNFYDADVVRDRLEAFGIPIHIDLGAELTGTTAGYVKWTGEIDEFGDGAIDVLYGTEASTERPVANSFWSGATVTLTAGVSPHGDASLDSHAPPVEFSLCGSFAINQHLLGLADLGLDFFDIDLDLYDFSNTNLCLISLDENFPRVEQFSETFYSIYGWKGFFEIPQLEPEDDAVDSQGRLMANDSFHFGNFTLDITDVFTQQKYLSFTTDEIAGNQLDYTVFGAEAVLDGTAAQSMTFDPHFEIHYEFDRSVKANGTWTTDVTLPVGASLSVEFPQDCEDPILVTPSIIIHGQLTNAYNIQAQRSLDGKAGEFILTINGFPMIPEAMNIGFDDDFEVCVDFNIFDICIDTSLVTKFVSIPIPAYTTDNVDIALGPTWEKRITLTPAANSTKTRNFELGGFEIIVLDSFELNPQVKPYAVPLPDGHPPYEVDEGSFVSLDGSQSYDLDDDPIRHYWDLDDDGSFETEGAVVDFLGVDGPFVHTVTLMANDPYGYRTESTTVEVHNVSPVVTFDRLDQPNPFFILPTVHELTFNGSFEDPGWIDTHTSMWFFGDGHSVAGAMTSEHDYPLATGTTVASHIYSAPGTYAVELYVEDDDSGEGMDSTVVTIIDANDALTLLNAYIGALPAGAFRGQAEQRKNALEQKIEATQTIISRSQYGAAINKLTNDLYAKADGSLGGKASDDWISSPGAQRDISHMLDDIIAYLRSL